MSPVVGGRDECQLAKKEAEARGISVAEFVRQAVRQSLAVKGQSPRMKYAGFVETGDPVSSRSIDEIAYGTKN